MRATMGLEVAQLQGWFSNRRFKLKAKKEQTQAVAIDSAVRDV